jgi:hypothetical protein
MTRKRDEMKRYAIAPRTVSQRWSVMRSEAARLGANPLSLHVWVRNVVQSTVPILFSSCRAATIRRCCSSRPKRNCQLIGREGSRQFLGARPITANYGRCGRIADETAPGGNPQIDQPEFGRPGVEIVVQALAAVRTEGFVRARVGRCRRLAQAAPRAVARPSRAIVMR